jgi:4-hydroxybenzoate polyprenyltransferase
MTAHAIWPELLGALRANLRSIGRSLILGLAASSLTMLAQLASEYALFLARGSWLKSFGFPIPWIGILKTSVFMNLHFYLYQLSFVQNWLFWTAIFFAVLFMWTTSHGELPFALLPTYVIGLSWARIQLEFQMAVAATGPIIAFARIDPFSYAQIAAYFAMALLLFPAIVTLVSRLPFREVFKLSCLGFPIILMPPILDYYVLKRPVIYNFFVAEFYQQMRGPLSYFAVLSPGIKIEILFVSTMTFAYLFYRTHSVVRSASAIIAAFLVFGAVSTPGVTSLLHLGFSQPQLFAGYVLIAYALTMLDFGFAQPGMGRTIIKGIRLRGIHFPAMALFGSFLTHPAILVNWIPEDFGLLIASIFVVYLVWQVATVFNDISDEDRKTELSGYLGYGGLIAVMAVFAAIPFGPEPLLLAFLAVCLAVAYPTLRRRHWLLSGLVIGASTCLAFLFGTLVPVNSASSPQPVGVIALAILVIFSGASLLKDITDVEGDKRSGIKTIFTRFETRIALFIVASFVAIGFVLPAVFLHALADRALLLAMGIASWVLIILAKGRSYKPVLALYFVEGVWVFIRLFVIGSSLFFRI